MAHRRPAVMGENMPALLASRNSCPWRATPVVFVLDDDVSVCQSLEMLIQAAGWRPAICRSAMEFLAGPRPHAPSCLLLGVLLPDLNGLELQARIAADRADTPIIVITGHSDVRMTVRAMQGGAIEFLTKPLCEELLLGAIGQALQRSRAVLRAEAQLWSLRERYSSLSRREREVMALVVGGRLNKQIAGKLSISEITVKAHRGNLMRKMHAHCLPELVNMAAMLRPDAPRQAREFLSDILDPDSASAR